MRIDAEARPLGLFDATMFEMVWEIALLSGTVNFKSVQAQQTAAEAEIRNTHELEVARVWATMPANNVCQLCKIGQDGSC